ncbi:DUF3108 domain-containing protein [Ideonella sp. DXS29W]|uniref:DUF3108 domain-containing protein n=1 Tax=Ideonella lacteola TaxID=2984193 RepID=A0ABU9BX10_9BURK
MPWPVFGFPVSSQLPARPSAVHWRRRGQVGGLALAVLGAHLWLIGPIQQPIGRTPGEPPTIQLVTLPPAQAPRIEPEGTAAPESAAPATTSAPTPAPTPAKPPAAQPPQEAPAPPETAPAPTEPAPAAEPPVAAPSPTDGPIDWAAGPPPPDPVSGTDSPVELPDMVTAAPVPGTVAGQQDVDGGGRPPIYTTQRPEQAFKLDYRIERGDDAGTGQLSYELRTGGVFVARFSAEIKGKVVHDYVSRGFFNSAGFAPQRMVERQRGVETRAINFQREQGVITFSGSTRAIALYPGSQDRTSVLLQLVAIAQAQPEGLRSGQRIRLQVATLRGVADEWSFEVVGDEVVQPGGSPIPVVHLKREPAAPFDQRVELWLARQAGHLPVGIRFTQVPGRFSEAYWLSSPLPPPPAASAPSTP